MENAVRGKNGLQGVRGWEVAFDVGDGKYALVKIFENHMTVTQLWTLYLWKTVIFSICQKYFYGNIIFWYLYI